MAGFVHIWPKIGLKQTIIFLSVCKLKLCLLSFELILVPNLYFLFILHYFTNFLLFPLALNVYIIIPELFPWNVIFIFIELIALHSGIAERVTHEMFPSKVDLIVLLYFIWLLSFCPPQPQPAIKRLYYYSRMIVLRARGDLGPQVPGGLIKPITCRSSLIICWRSLSIIR